MRYVVHRRGGFHIRPLGYGIGFVADAARWHVVSLPLSGKVPRDEADE